MIKSYRFWNKRHFSYMWRNWKTQGDQCSFVAAKYRLIRNKIIWIVFAICLDLKELDGWGTGMRSGLKGPSKVKGSNREWKDQCL